MGRIGGSLAQDTGPQHIHTNLVLRAVADAMRAYDKADDVEGGVPTHDILWKLLCDVDAATATRPIGGGTWTELAGQLDAAALAVALPDLVERTALAPVVP